MKYILVTGHPRTDETAQMEIISEDGTTVICQNSQSQIKRITNFGEKNVMMASAAVTDGTMVVCGGYVGKFF